MKLTSFAVLWLAAVLAQAGPPKSKVVVEPSDETTVGKALFDQHCASCHSGSTAGSPAEPLLAELSQTAILNAMNSGAMREQARELEPEQRRLVAQFLTRNRPPTASARVLRCTDDDRVDLASGKASGWGVDLANRRWVPPGETRIRVTNAHRLTLRWAFAYPNANRARSQPLVLGSLVVVGSHDGTVFGLDRGSGCVRWTFAAKAEVRNGVTALNLASVDGAASRTIGFFSDFQARAYAIDLENGKLVWQAPLSNHPGATGTGQAAAYGDTVYFPVSSVEVGNAADANYPCCTFRGSVVALDARTGERRWQAYTIAQAPRPQGENSAGTPRMGPSGAPVWGAPTIDAERGLVYVGTGENYSDPATLTSDAILAFELQTGRLRWSRQATANDVWNAACIKGFGSPANCPASPGPDFDFGAPPILVRGEPRSVLVAGQKSGIVYGLDPDDGALLWQRRLGRGGILGGVHFGMAADETAVYVPVNDSEVAWEGEGTAAPGLNAIDPMEGRVLWRAPARPQICEDATACERGISAPVTVAGDVVFAPHGNGLIRAHAAATGRELWRYDTAKAFDTVSGDRATGGGLSGGSGPVVADAWLFVNSGYYMVLSPAPGNVLLAFSVE